MTPLEAVSDAVLPWIIRITGLLWLVGAVMLFRQIRMEMALDRMTTRVEEIARELQAAEETAEPTEHDERPLRDAARPAEEAVARWIDRDNAARRGWIAGQAVVLGATAATMIALSKLAAWMVALLVAGHGVYFFWREFTARRAPGPEAAAHARPTKSTVNAGWVALVIAMLVWSAAFRGLLN